MHGLNCQCLFRVEKKWKIGRTSEPTMSKQPPLQDLQILWVVCRLQANKSLDLESLPTAKKILSVPCLSNHLCPQMTWHWRHCSQRATSNLKVFKLIVFPGMKERQHTSFGQRLSAVKRKPEYPSYLRMSESKKDIWTRRTALAATGIP